MYLTYHMYTAFVLQCWFVRLCTFPFSTVLVRLCTGESMLRERILIEYGPREGNSHFPVESFWSVSRLFSTSMQPYFYYHHDRFESELYTEYHFHASSDQGPVLNRKFALLS